MRRYAIWFGLAKRRPTIGAASASNCFHSYCAMAGFTVAAVLDAGASALAGPAELRTSRAADRLSGGYRCDRRRRSAPAPAGAAARGHRAELVEGTGRRSLPGDAGRFVYRRGDLRRRNRRRAPVRQPAPADVFSRLGPGGELDRGDGAPQGAHPGRNRRARRVLVEAAWTYRYPARVGETLRARLEGLPKIVRDIAWKGQVRLCARYRRLSNAGKKLPVVVAAIARDGGLPVGDWPPGGAHVKPDPPRLRLHSAGGGATVGNSRR
jgi:hypothetical protein